VSSRLPELVQSVTASIGLGYNFINQVGELGCDLSKKDLAELVSQPAYAQERLRQVFPYFLGEEFLFLDIAIR
jgi:hypothetical protein